MSGWVAIAPGAEALAHLDPYLEFAEETGHAYLFAGGPPHDPRIPLLIELKPGGNRNAAAFAEAWGHNPWVRIPNAYRRPPKGLQRARILTAQVGLRFFRELADPGSELGEWVSQVTPGLPVNEISIGAPLSEEQPSGRAIRGMVVTGIIDDGLAFAHQNFRTGTATRVAFLWDQGDGAGPPPGFGYGRHYTRLQIDGFLNAPGNGKYVDEEWIYRTTRHADFSRSVHKPVAQRISHGTHVMDLATALEDGERSDLNPIIGVQLPVSTTAQTSGATLARHLLDGLRYIIDRADQLALERNCGPLPIVVNISYGLIAGPHDGSSVIEKAMDELVTLRSAIAPMRIVIPAGNSYLARCHANFKLDAGGRQVLRWRVLPDDRTPSFLEIWLPELKHAHARVRVTVKTPTGSTSLPVMEGGICAWKPNGEILCKIIYLNGVAAGRKRNMILVALAPTATLDRAAEVAPAGVWEIQLDNRGPAATVDAWIQRDDTAPGYPLRGRQSYFDDPEYRRFDNGGRAIEDDTIPANDSYVKREGTINAIATGSRTIVAGGFRHSDLLSAKTSASGPVIQPPGRGVPNTDGPECMAPSEDSPALPNRLAAGSRSGSCAAMAGTSVAAPQVTRWVARQLAHPPQLGDRADVFDEAKLRDPGGSAASKPPRNRGGGGRIPFPPRIKRGIEP